MYAKKISTGSLMLHIGALLIFFLSCEREISLEIEGFEPKIVVNGILEAGKAFNVHVCSSKNILSQSENINLDKAIVKIYEGSDFFFLSSTGEGNFSHPSKRVMHGANYHIEVSYPGFKTVKSNATIPGTLDAEVSYSETFDYKGKLALRVDFKIKDNPDEDNYYIYEILNLYPNAPTDPNSIPFLDSPIKSWLSSLDGNIGYIDDVSEKQSKLFITDNTFRGSILNTSLVSFVEIQEQGSNNPIDVILDYYTPDFTDSKLKVTAASKELYEYYKSVELFIQKKALNSSISTPITPFTNIENGLGIFAGFSSLILSLEN
jgi:hypothetical protein